MSTEDLHIGMRVKIRTVPGCPAEHYLHGEYPYELGRLGMLLAEGDKTGDYARHPDHHYLVQLDPIGPRGRHYHQWYSAEEIQAYDP